jgi:hypothetical protein
VLALGLAAGCLLDLGLVLAAGSGAGSLGSGLFAGGALDLLALDLVGDAGGVCHDVSSLCATEFEIYCAPTHGDEAVMNGSPIML